MYFLMFQELGEGCPLFVHLRNKAVEEQICISLGVTFLRLKIVHQADVMLRHTVTSYNDATTICHLYLLRFVSCHLDKHSESTVPITIWGQS